MRTLVITIMLSAAVATACAKRNLVADGTSRPETETGSTARQEEYKREITKDFSVGANPNLSISNKYGNIRIIEGTENKIMFKIEIIGKGSTRERAREYAENISVNFSQNGNSVSAVTELKSISCNNCGRTIHYTVVAPRSVTMKLENKYGNINLDNVAKPLNIDLKYGNLSAGTIADADIDIKYGNIVVSSCDEAKIDIKYGNLNIDRAKTLRVDSKYDKIHIGAVSTFYLETGYTNVQIDKLEKRFVADDLDYGGLTISEISPSFEEIKVDAKYTNVRLALNSNHSFKAILHTHYGNIEADGLTFNNVALRKNSSIVGNVGNNSNPSANVVIDASYGNIIFK
ncbi:MAG: DUF4097 domain-containing protein [Tannerella sp.]|jgi:hypothetical protein|nr:DUF4097 domain-containing protein [Tannerella sp.]